MPFRLRLPIDLLELIGFGYRQAKRIVLWGEFDRDSYNVKAMQKNNMVKLLGAIQSILFNAIVAFGPSVQIC